MKVAGEVEVIEVRERNNEMRARVATKAMYDCKGRLLASGGHICDCLRQVSLLMVILCFGAGEESVLVYIVH